MANQKQKGGYSKTLKKVSKELAGASKMHAGQSKKTATLARQLLKKQTKMKFHYLYNENQHQQY